MGTSTEAPIAAFNEDDFRLDTQVIVSYAASGATIPCDTGDGCGETCVDGASACSSFIDDPS